ncbi:MAG: topoisomerase [Labilithrix sp.]|nr:topoisomerase [Labilithrix sp.]
MTVVVVAEKPSVARDIASVLGARTRQDGYFEGGGYVVTWAIGHLVALAEPHDMNPAWKRWSLADLPLLPAEWPLVPGASTREQFAVVKRWLVAPGVRGIVCATDAGREGELIFRYIYEAARAKKPFKRLWISSLTPEAIAQGFRTLQEGEAFDRLADAARARSRADWLVGMNLSRVYSIRHDDNLSVGRVQTPTLAMIVARELEIRAFVPEDYLEVVATFDAPAGDPRAAEPYRGTWLRAKGQKDATRLHADGREAKEILARAATGQAAVESVDRQTRKIPPPELYDLTELQRHANRLYGYTAQRTLDIAQRLYEQRKLLSYPRTDSRHLSAAIAETLPAVVAAIRGPYEAHLAEGTGARPLGRRFVDDARVSDHHAILPTEKRPPAELPVDERNVYELVCRRLLSAWHADHVLGVTTVITTITNGDVKDRFTSAGTSVENVGWKVLDVTRPSADVLLPGGLAAGLPRRVTDARSVAKKTKPPPRFSDATLLTAMETAGRTLDEKELSRAMRDCGLGTPATRAAILETLLRREYVVREEKTLRATDKGVSLIEIVHEDVKSPAMTGEWERRLANIEKGMDDLPAFMTAIESYVTKVVGAPPKAPVTPLAPRSGPVSSSAAPRLPVGGIARPARPVTTDRDLGALLHSAFGFAAFRPYQEAVCRAAAAGHDVLLVMPTGAGKSLCYQLPGLARGGTTLVISPLIALMEDQVGQLQKRGFVAERIHSGRDRTASRAACRQYLDGALDFLFIAPERLKVPGFTEMLARRKPTLVAIDEAHCISQWGHDFRPDYRMLGERLPALRPAPIIALTATATPRVQDDIARELRLVDADRFIHGFRRTNIGVEVLDRNPTARGDVVKRLLADPARRPAIVYAPTRKDAEQLASELGKKRLKASAYHAGLSNGTRDGVQAAFLGGLVDVIVATTAFGMGIDKANVRTVIHTALPGSVEGYYQEIGRAGRDGLPSRAILLHSFVDSKTHEFFMSRDYPEDTVLAKIEKAIVPSGMTRDELARKTRLSEEDFDKAFEKLWVHGGAVVAPGDVVTRGSAAWRAGYALQRSHKREQLSRMRQYAETASCRMLQLVRHFGDQQDAGEPCGQCDVCAPAACIAQAFRAPTDAEADASARILAALRALDGRSVGQVHRDVFDGAIERRSLDHLLGALSRSGQVRIVSDEFVKDGETIAFQRVYLAEGAAAGGDLRMVLAPAPTKKKTAAAAATKTRAFWRARAVRKKAATKRRPPRRS